ncbi:hypothetical protein [Mycobacterium bourgelatii]|uniref:hypothetical protein n=1 Tax=Mycobacterium bourgelatii TaxID=1273442 RepID=UPI001F077038|nr:hypothetical protein [Mycobacterium bourgelatii]
MIAAGVPLVTVSRHLGHESAQLTANVYTDVDRSAHQVAADTMAKLLNPKNPKKKAAHEFGKNYRAALTM